MDLENLSQEQLLKLPPPLGRGWGSPKRPGAIDSSPGPAKDIMGIWAGIESIS